MSREADASPTSGLRHAALTIVGALYVLLADYEPLLLAGVICLLFVVYISVRLLIWFQNDRFTPLRLRVGVTWALIGIDEAAKEYDTAPVRTYFSLLVILFAGLLLRPVLGWLL